MKTVCLFFILAIFSLNALANKIDSLKTDEQVLDFVKRLNIYIPFDSVEILSDKVFTQNMGNWKADTLHYSMIKELSEKSNQKFWQKLDLNADGETDLLVTISPKKGFHTMVIAVLGNKSNLYTVKTFNRFVVFDEVATAITVEDIPCILLNWVDLSNCKTNETSSCPIRTDLLTWKFGDFIEFNSPSNKYPKVTAVSIDERAVGISQFRASKIQIDLTSKRIDYYKETMYMDSIGEHIVSEKGIISDTDKKRIEGLLNYMDFISLKDTFDCGATDMPDASLKITYNNGQVKNISDWGQNGTYGLMVLYNTLINIKYSNAEKKQ